MSPRIYQHVSKWSKRAVLLLPSVEEKYFLKPSEKNISDKLRITYLGRVDPGKGTMSAVEIVRRLASQKNIESRICGFSWPRLPDTVSLEKKLLVDSNIRYESVKPDKWTDVVDDNLRTLLHETDILLLPYHKLSSTIDTPLLLLEGMASLCAIITKPLGDIPGIYGKSKFLISSESFIDDTTTLLKNLSFDDLAKERKRVYDKNKKINFATGAVVEIFINAIKEHQPG